MLHKSLFATALTLLMLTGCSDTKKVEEANAMVSSSDYTLRDLANNSYSVTKEGNDFHLKGHEDKVVFFDIFGTWCPPCRAEAPHLANLQKKFPDNLKIIGVAIDRDKPDSFIAEFRETYGADYTLVNGPENQRLARSIAASLQIGQNFPIPLMVIYKNGRYVTHYVGAVPEEMIESDIKAAVER